MMRVTELQSVIAELTRKLNEATGNKIIEEDEEIEESQCSSDLEGEGLFVYLAWLYKICFLFI